MGPFPCNWLAARIANLTPDLLVLLSWGDQLLSASTQGSLSPSVSSMLAWAFLPPPPPPRVLNLYTTFCSDCTTRSLHMPKPAKPSLSQNEVRSSSPSFASNLLDLTSATSFGLMLRICLIMALSLRCNRCRFVLVSGQVLLAKSMAHKSCVHGQGSYKRGGGM